MSGCGKGDPYCTGGVTRCAGCRGHGRVRGESGKPYRKFSNIQPSSREHEPCHGSGLEVCGCVPVAPAELADQVSGAYRAIQAVMERNREAAALVADAVSAARSELLTAQHYNG